jgi:hypothetical protein
MDKDSGVFAPRAEPLQIALQLSLVASFPRFPVVLPSLVAALVWLVLSRYPC